MELGQNKELSIQFKDNNLYNNIHQIMTSTVNYIWPIDGLWEEKKENKSFVPSRAQSKLSPWFISFRLG